MTTTDPTSAPTRTTGGRHGLVRKALLLATASAILLPTLAATASVKRMHLPTLRWNEPAHP